MSDYTFTFKEIFPTYEDFKSFCTEYGIDITSDIIAPYISQVYNYLFNAYCNSNVKFDMIGDFKRCFAVELENQLTRFSKQLALLNKIYNISEEDIVQIGEAIANFSDSPNTTVTDVKKALNFITTQNYSISKNNKLVAYITAIQSLPDMQIEEFTKKFRWLFISIIPNVKYYYTGE